MSDLWSALGAESNTFSHQKTAGLKYKVKITFPLDFRMVDGERIGYDPNFTGDDSAYADGYKQGRNYWSDFRDEFVPAGKSDEYRRSYEWGWQAGDEVLTEKIQLDGKIANPLNERANNLNQLRRNANLSFFHTADQGFGPDEDSQSGYGESQLEMVDVENAPEDSNLGWIKSEASEKCANCGKKVGAKDLKCKSCGYLYPSVPKFVKDSSHNASRKTTARVEHDPNDPYHRFWKCVDCGAQVDRYHGDGDVECPKCRAEYNSFGQRLRDNWRDNQSNWDDDIDDMEGYERSQLRYESAVSRKTATSIQDLYDGSSNYDPDDWGVCNSCGSSFLLGDALALGVFKCPDCGSQDVGIGGQQDSDYSWRMHERQQMGTIGSRKTAGSAAKTPEANAFVDFALSSGLWGSFRQLAVRYMEREYGDDLDEIGSSDVSITLCSALDAATKGGPLQGKTTFRSSDIATVFHWLMDYWHLPSLAVASRKTALSIDWVSEDDGPWGGAVGKYRGRTITIYKPQYNDVFFTVKIIDLDGREVYTESGWDDLYDAMDDAEDMVKRNFTGSRRTAALPSPIIVENESGNGGWLARSQFGGHTYELRLVGGGRVQEPEIDYQYHYSYVVTRDGEEVLWPSSTASDAYYDAIASFSNYVRNEYRGISN